MNTILNHINSFRPITLDAMDQVALLKRTDTKFVIRKDKIAEILPLLGSDYHALEIGKNRIMTYHSAYFDTDSFTFYNDHLHQRKVRAKVRVREYVESNIQFIEVKQKTNKGQTIKTRVKTEQDDLLNKTNSFAEQLLQLPTPLKQSIRNDFKRFTLVSNRLKERVTFDMDLRFNDAFWDPNLAIIELKQEYLKRSSPVFQILKKLHVHPSRISKYCLGMSNTYPQLKTNNFKPIFRNIKKQLA